MNRRVHWRRTTRAPKRVGDELRLRILFAVEPEFEDEVRQRIDAALGSSKLVRPDGAETTWHLGSTQRGEVLDTELDHARRLIRS
jgi:hypothetical protein